MTNGQPTSAADSPEDAGDPINDRHDRTRPSPRGHGPAALGRFVAARLDTVVPWSLAVGLSLAFIQLSWLRWWSPSRSVDLGYFRQAEWLITHGESAFITSRGLHLLSDHFSPIIFPISGLSWLIPGNSGLLVIQSAALGLAIVPLWRLARGPGGLDVRGAAIVAALYALSPVTHNLALSGFHPEVVVVPVILWAMLFAHERKWLAFAITIGIILAAKEDLALLVVGFGIMLLVRRDTRAGVATIVAGTAWFLLAAGVIMPWIGGGELEQVQRYSQYGDSTGEVVRFVATHPWHVLSDLATAQNLELIVALLAPVAFVPLLAWRVLLAVVPFELALLLTNQDLAHTIDAHYTVAAASVVFAATALGLRRLTGPRPGRAIAAVLILVCASGLVVWSAAAPSENPLAWNDANPLDSARREALDFLPNKAAVAVTAELAEAASQRKQVYNFPQPFDYWEEPSRTGSTVEERRDAVEWVVVDTNAAWTWPRSREEWIDDRLPALGFEPVYDEEGVLVFRR